MQIFVPSPDPIESAKYLDDKRVVKMVLESAQLLSNLNGGPYRPTHLNHPCMRWLREVNGAKFWLKLHLQALLIEYTNRYGKVHKCESLGLHLGIDNSNPVDYFCNATTHHKHIADVHLAYRLELDLKWKSDTRTPTWYRSLNRPII